MGQSARIWVFLALVLLFGLFADLGTADPVILNHEAIVFQKYSGMHLCKKHFVEDVERKIKLTIRREYSIQKNDVIAVALSGGKDSSVVLYVMHKILGNRPDIKIIAISVDEGINGYRPHSLELAKSLTKMLGVQHIIKSFKDVHGS